MVIVWLTLLTIDVGLMVFSVVAHRSAAPRGTAIFFPHPYHGEMAQDVRAMMTRQRCAICALKHDIFTLLHYYMMWACAQRSYTGTARSVCGDRTHSGPRRANRRLGRKSCPLFRHEYDMSSFCTSSERTRCRLEPDQSRGPVADRLHCLMSACA